MKRIFAAFSLSAILSVAVFAAVSAVQGQWTVEGTSPGAPRVLALTVNGTTLTGTIDGVTITQAGTAGNFFWFHAPRNGADYTYKGQVKASGEVDLQILAPGLSQEFLYARTQ